MLTLATQDQAERRETTSRAIGGPVSRLVDQTPSTLILKMGVKKMIEVSLSFSCLSLVFLLKTSKLLLWKGLIYSYIEIE